MKEHTGMGVNLHASVGKMCMVGLEKKSRRNQMMNVLKMYECEV